MWEYISNFGTLVLGTEKRLMVINCQAFFISRAWLSSENTVLT